MSTPGLSLNERNEHALQLAQKIIADFQSDPNAASVKATKLAETLLDVYSIGSKDGSVAAIEKAGFSQETKSLFLSKTFWGIVLTLAGPGLKYLGIHLGSTDLSQIAGEAVTFFGAAFAIYGRITVKAKIH